MGLFEKIKQFGKKTTIATLMFASISAGFSSSVKANPGAIAGIMSGVNAALSSEKSKEELFNESLTSFTNDFINGEICRTLKFSNLTTQKFIDSMQIINKVCSESKEINEIFNSLLNDKDKSLISYHDFYSAVLIYNFKKNSNKLIKDSQKRELILSNLISNYNSDIRTKVSVEEFENVMNVLFPIILEIKKNDGAIDAQSQEIIDSFRVKYLKGMTLENIEKMNKVLLQIFLILASLVIPLFIITMVKASREESKINKT